MAGATSQEKAGNVRVEEGHRFDEDHPQIRIDWNGLPLVPQPSASPDDPLNWSPKWKLFVALQVSWLAFLGPLSAAVINPAFVPLGKSFGISTLQASYELLVYTFFAGIGPLFAVPIANIYGRRPIYLMGNLLAATTNIAAGYTTSWAGLMATRAINGMASGSPAIGAATICDLYFMHERGLYMGIFTLFLTNGPHLASLLGGFIAQHMDWHWCYRIPAFVQLLTLAVNVFCLPETLRNTHEVRERNFRSRFSLVDTNTQLGIQARDFLKPFLMATQIAVVIPAIYYMTAFAYGSVIFASTGSQLFRSLYNFTTSQTGLMLSIPLLVGCLIGEASTGWFTDWLVLRHAKRNDGKVKPEARIHALWLGLLVPVGLVIEGFCLATVESVPWIGAAMGMALASFGLQAATTVTYAYCTDCYQPHSTEISVLLNLFRCVFSGLVGFYALPLADQIGIEFAWLTFAMINVVLFVPFLALARFGGHIRKIQDTR